LKKDNRKKERVARLVASKGLTEKEATEIVEAVIATKEAEPGPVPAGATGPLGRLANGQRFFVPGVVGDFLLEGWKLAPGVFDQATDDLKKCPEVRQIAQRRTAAREERLMKAAVMTAWDQKTVATAIDESKAQTKAPQGPERRYNYGEPRSGEERNEMGKATKKGSKKSNGAGNGFRAHNVTLSVKRMPKEGEVPAQAAAIMAVLKGLGKGASPDELVAAMKGKVESRQGMRAALNLHRAKLAKAGFIAVAPAVA
jgi:hypothetical protein